MVEGNLKIGKKKQGQTVHKKALRWKDLYLEFTKTNEWEETRVLEEKRVRGSQIERERGRY